MQRYIDADGFGCFKKMGVHHDALKECTIREKKNIETELKPFMDQLPEYKSLISAIYKY